MFYSLPTIITELELNTFAVFVNIGIMVMKKYCKINDR